MRCLYCGKRLSLLKQIGSRQFCCEAHQTQYLQDQESLGLARLIEANRQSVRGVSRRGKQKSAHSRPGAPPPMSERFFPFHRQCQNSGNAILTAGDPVTQPVVLTLPLADAMVSRCAVPRAAAQVPQLVTDCSAGIIPLEEQFCPSFSAPVQLPVDSIQAPRRAFAVPPAGNSVKFPPRPAVTEGCSPETLATASPELESRPPSPLLPVTETVPSCELPALTAAMKDSSCPRPFPPALDSRPLEFRAEEEFPDSTPSGVWNAELAEDAPAVAKLANATASFVFDPSRSLAPADARQTVRTHPLPVPPSAPIPPASNLLRSGKPRMTLLAPVKPAGIAAANEKPTAEVEHVTLTPSAWRPRFKAQRKPLVLAQTLALPVPFSVDDNPPRAMGITAEHMPPAAFLVPPSELGIIAPAAPNTHSELAPLEWKPPVSAAEAVPVFASSEAIFPESALALRMPEAGTALTLDGGLSTVDRHQQVPAGSPAAIPTAAPAFSAQWNAPAGPGEHEAGPLVLNDGPVTASGTPLVTEAAPAPEFPELIPLAVEKIIPLDAAAVSEGKLDLLRPAPKPLIPLSSLETLAPPAPEIIEKKRHGPPLWETALQPVVAGWQSVPAGIKYSMLVVPLLVALLFHSTDKLPTVAADTNVQGAGAAFADRWHRFQENIAGRAAISLNEDFRSGLGAWEGTGDWAASWSYDKAGFVRPGDLALYRASLPLRDYRMEFSGQVEKRGLDWVYRAADTSNYYAAKLVVVDPGPLPKAELVRYAVVGGKKGRPTVSKIPFPLRNGRMYRIGVDVRGQNVTTYLDGRVVDFFRDDRLQHGGIGFFSDRGERARLRWVSVVHQYDFLGRLCALLAPYSLENPPRS